MTTPVYFTISQEDIRLRSVKITVTPGKNKKGFQPTVGYMVCLLSQALKKRGYTLLIDSVSSWHEKSMKDLCR